MNIHLEDRQASLAEIRKAYASQKSFFRQVAVGFICLGATLLVFLWEIFAQYRVMVCVVCVIALFMALLSVYVGNGGVRSRSHVASLVEQYILRHHTDKFIASKNAEELKMRVRVGLVHIYVLGSYKFMVTQKGLPRDGIMFNEQQRMLFDAGTGDLVPILIDPNSLSTFKATGA